ncbi:MAG: FAD-dependent oxidoreductase, partial [Pseudomonadota bacterium]
MTKDRSVSGGCDFQDGLCGAEREYDLCIIGAGVAGLNALFVASRYLGRDAQVAIVDRNATCGGMWNSVYDYVRLHQPYRLFTVGDIAWRLDKPADYLANGAEVLDHFQHCLARIRRDLSLDAYWECEVTDIRECDGQGCRTVDVAIQPTTVCAEERIIRTKRVIDARGFDVPTIEPLALSSKAVVSLAPRQFSSVLTGSDARPIYVVGGGKTGLDTAHAALTDNPNRKVALIAGRGTVFTNRDIVFPVRLQRLFGRRSNLSAAIDTVMRFDGTNAADVVDYYRRTYGITPVDQAENFFFGLLSENESAFVRKRLTTTISDYLTDVADTQDGPRIQLRGGETIPVEESAVIVNCTGYLTRRQSPMKPLLSGSGRVLSITPRAAFNVLPGISAYFSTHLMFQGALQDPAFFIIDNEALLETDDKTWHMAALAQVIYNTIYALDVLPMKAFQEFGLDF